MPALWEVEGMIEDRHGTGLFRAAVITHAPYDLPKILPLMLDKVVTEIRSLKLVEEIDEDYRVGRLKIADNILILVDEVRAKRYIREGEKWQRL